jgi:hypothetical protein
MGLDWSPSPALLCHVNLVARTDAGDSLRGHAGTPEAYLEAKLRPGESRIRLRAGATVFRGNDTLGALPVDRGWEFHDRWTLLGERVESGGEYYTSVSAENDGRLGWSGRAGWNGNRFSVLFTHIDNRSDGLPYGKLYNWTTRFEVAGFDLSLNDWTVAGEAGWGPTSLVVGGTRYRSDLRAGYLLLTSPTTSRCAPRSTGSPCTRPLVRGRWTRRGARRCCATCCARRSPRSASFRAPTAWCASP